MKTYQELADQLDGVKARIQFHSDRMNMLAEGNRNEMGLTSDAVKSSPDYRRHKKEFDSAMAHSRDLMRIINKNYKKQHALAVMQKFGRVA